jgi:DNA-binding PadR family transcriptional regulator
MPIQHAVLALLAERPSYGYELKANFERGVGPQWGDLNIGHLYQVLDRLVKAGQVEKKVVEQSDRPDKLEYRLTRAGRDELDEWLTTPFVRQGGYRDDFFLKLFAAARLGRDALYRVIRVQREAYMTELASLVRLKGDFDGEPLVGLLIDAAVLHTEANLRIVEQAAEQAPKLTATETAVPQQGRASKQRRSQAS